MLLDNLQLGLSWLNEIDFLFKFVPKISGLFNTLLIVYY